MEEFEDDINVWFGLTYASYLTIPRVALESMPDEWQIKFVAMLKEMNETLEDWDHCGYYYVTLRDDKGRILHDPYKEYRHKRIPLRVKEEPSNE